MKNHATTAALAALLLAAGPAAAQSAAPQSAPRLPQRAPAAQPNATPGAPRLPRAPGAEGAPAAPTTAPATVPPSGELVAPASAPKAPPPAPTADDSQPPAPGEDNGETLWPQETTADGVTYTLFTPQFESMDATRATARAAFSMQKAAPSGTDATAAATPAPASAGASDPATYGAIFFNADIDNDGPAGLIELSNLAVQRVQLAGSGDSAPVAAAIQKMLAGTSFTVNRALVMQNMQVAKDQASSRAKLNNTPPKIRVVDHAAVLLLLDGAPVLRELDGGSVGMAQNTSSLLAYEKPTNLWFTRVGTDTWMHSSRWKGPYIGGKAPLPDSAKAIEAALPKRHPDAKPSPTPPAGQLPEVIVSTQPMCLVSTNGQPQLTQVADGLMGVSNANCDLFTTTADNAWWLLSSGRWFRAPNLVGGQWSYVAPSALPASFAQIDPHGSWGNVLAAVPGTPEATDALFQQSVPHVATLDRRRATPKPSTSGGPARFKAIEGTDMKYAVNANEPLVLCQGRYYLCENAAWFVGPAANGPWALCDSVPEEIYTIPPSCPIYGCTYVQVYNATPDAVTTGYTAGYMNSYENEGTVSYGTGYAYPGTTGAGDVVLGDNSDVTDDPTWDWYGGWPNTYGSYPSYGTAYGGWGYYGYPGWGGYGLYCGPYWCGSGWYGTGRAFGVGYALGMGYGNAWDWGYHPWGWRDGSGWWNNHWSGAYTRGWGTAGTPLNRAAGASGEAAARQMNAYARSGDGGAFHVPAAATGVNHWQHATGVADNVMASRDGQVLQRRGDQTYARSNGAWQRTSATGADAVRADAATAARAADGSWRDAAAGAQQRSGGSGFQERDGSVSATAHARTADYDGFRPDPNHNFDGSPRGAFARGETNYADRGGGSYQQGDGVRAPGAYQRGGNWNGGGWGVGDQVGTAAQRWGNDYDRGTRGFNQDTGWYDRSASRPANPYGGGYSGWSNGYRGYGSMSGWGGARMGGYGGGRSFGGARGGGGRR